MPLCKWVLVFPMPGNVQVVCPVLLSGHFVPTPPGQQSACQVDAEHQSQLYTEMTCSYLPVAMFFRDVCATEGVEVEDRTLFFDPEVFFPLGCFGSFALGVYPGGRWVGIWHSACKGAFLRLLLQPRRFAST